jgi:signal transduction histidine kinase
MKRKEILKNTFALFFVSCIYTTLLYALFTLLHSSAIALISIVFVSYISWKQGTIAGLTLTAFNFAGNGLTFHILAPELVQSFTVEAATSIGVHIGVAFLLGYFGKLARNLKKEVEVRKQAESLLKKYQNELEERVEARTRELEKTNEKLHQAEKMEAIGQLAGGIAHDFNNYLNIILGYSTLLLDKLDAHSPENDFAQKIEKTAQTASELTSQLLTFARKKKYELQSINVNDLVDELIPLLSRGVKKNITIQHITESEIPLIRGGTAQIQNALLNLALNARDAMENGGTLTFATKTIQVTPEYCRDNGISCKPGSYIGVSVSDTGSGIEPDALNHLFEPFYTTKTEGKGTGMGLAAVYGIAQSHKGAVFAETQVGKGTTFTMLFPVTMEDVG